jgi:hypothetical protein
MKAHPPTPTAYSHPPDAWLHMQCNCILVSRTAEDFVEIHLFTIIHLKNPLSIPFQSWPLPKIRFISLFELVTLGKVDLRWNRYLPKEGHIAITEYGQDQDNLLTNNQLSWSRLLKLD